MLSTSFAAASQTASCYKHLLHPHLRKKRYPLSKLMEVREVRATLRLQQRAKSVAVRKKIPPAGPLVNDVCAQHGERKAKKETTACSNRRATSLTSRSLDIKRTIYSFCPTKEANSRNTPQPTMRNPPLNPHCRLLPHQSIPRRAGVPFWDTMQRMVSQIGFARSLGFYDGMHVTSLGQQGSMLEAVYTIPDNICVSGGTFGGGGGAFLPCGVTTAIFDEVSVAVCLFMADITSLDRCSPIDCTATGRMPKPNDVSRESRKSGSEG